MAIKPIAPKPNFKIKPTRKKAMPAPGSGNDPVSKALKFFLGDQTKPSKKKRLQKRLELKFAVHQYL